MKATDSVTTVERHLAGVRDLNNDAEVASDSPWTVISGNLSHSETVGQAYRFVMEAWNFSLVAAKLSDAGAGRVTAELRLDNGHNYHKIVSAEYEVEKGLIVAAKLHDAEAVINNG